MILLDTDILIDVALDRAPFAEPAGLLLNWLEQHPGNACIAWHTIANFYYLVRPAHGSAPTKAMIIDLVQFVDVVKTNTADLRIAVQLNMKDFEDAMQSAAALAGKAQVIATRNLGDYKHSPVPASTPADLVESDLSRFLKFQ